MLRELPRRHAWLADIQEVIHALHPRELPRIPSLFDSLHRKNLQLAGFGVVHKNCLGFATQQTVPVTPLLASMNTPEGGKPADTNVAINLMPFETMSRYIPPLMHIIMGETNNLLKELKAAIIKADSDKMINLMMMHTQKLKKY